MKTFNSSMIKKSYESTGLHENQQLSQEKQPYSDF